MLDALVALGLGRVRGAPVASVPSCPFPAFQRALDRLTDHALVQRRLQPQGERYETQLTLTSRGSQVAEVLEGLGTRARSRSTFPKGFGPTSSRRSSGTPRFEKAGAF